MNNNFRDEIFIAAMERTIRRLWILCIILIIAFVASNLGWLYYESQFEEVTETKTVETDASDGGDATGIIGGHNEVNNGESEGDVHKDDKAEKEERQ